MTGFVVDRCTDAGDFLPPLCASLRVFNRTVFSPAGRRTLLVRVCPDAFRGYRTNESYKQNRKLNTQ